MTLILIAYGSNSPIDNTPKEKVIARALDELEEQAAVNILSTSRFYQSSAVPASAGPDFLNGAGVVESTLSPEALLAALHRAEAQLGRVRTIRWGPRAVDLDLLAMGDTVLPDRPTEQHWRELDAAVAAVRTPDRLILPHPRMAERAFVLAPLAEVAPDWRHPVLGRTVREMLEALPDDARADLRAIAPHPWTVRQAGLEPDGVAPSIWRRPGADPPTRVHRLCVVRMPGMTGVKLRSLDQAGHTIVETWHRHAAEAVAEARVAFGDLDWVGVDADSA